MKKSVVFDYVISNKKNFIIILSLFLIGIIIGIFCINNTKSNEINEITNYVSTLKENIQTNQNIDKFLSFCESLKQNLKLIFLIWILGSTIIGSFFIYIIILYKGFSVGYTISAIIASLGVQKGSIFVFSSLLVQNIIFLPALFIMAESGLKVYTRIIKKNVNLKAELLRNFTIMIIVSCVSVISSITETYISTNLLVFFKNFI